MVEGGAVVLSMVLHGHLNVQMVSAVEEEALMDRIGIAFATGAENEGTLSQVACGFPLNCRRLLKL